MADDLTEGEAGTLHAALLTLREELRALLAPSGIDDAPVALDQQAVGRVSRIDAIQQQQMAAAQRRRAELRLKQIEVALRAWAEEEYGDCRRCGEPIGYARLSARPECPCCVPCMTAIERGG